MTWVQYFTAFGGTTLCVLIITFIFNWVVNSGKKAKSRKKKELQEIVEEAINNKIDPVHEQISLLNKKVESVEKKVDDLQKDVAKLQQDVDTLQEDVIRTKEAIQAELRHDIRNSCRRCIAQKFRTEDDTDEVEQLHAKYEGLNVQNGLTNSLYEEFKKLPLVPNDYKAPSKKKLNESKK